MNPDDTPLALEMRAWFAARRLCLLAGPPCVTRPCERHHAEMTAALGAVPCGSCERSGLILDEPCCACDGYGRLWSTLAVAPTGVTGPAAGAPVGGAAGDRLTYRKAPECRDDVEYHEWDANGWERVPTEPRWWGRP